MTSMVETLYKASKGFVQLQERRVRRVKRSGVDTCLIIPQMIRFSGPFETLLVIRLNQVVYKHS